MIAGTRIFARYLRDEGGAYAVAFALMVGFLSMAAHVGLDALRFQNSETAGEQLVDIACQKIATADPALYPTAAALKAAVESQMATRRVAGTDATDGSIIVEPIEFNPNFVTPITKNTTVNDDNVDLRRWNFKVSYKGDTKGLHKDLVKDGNAKILVAKRCRPVCSGFTNIIYSNAAALGHWFQNGRVRAAQRVDSNGNNIEPFNDVIFVDGKTRTFNAGDKVVLTITSVAADQSERIRLRQVLTMPVSFYFDNDRTAVKGEPWGKVTRYIVDDDDTIALQALNADGSLPGVCGEAKDAVCTGPDCGGTGGGCTGSDCTDPVTTVPIEKICPGINITDAPWKGLWKDIDITKRTILFEYPKNNQPGNLYLRWSGGKEVQIKLAPFYVPNDRVVTGHYSGVTRAWPIEMHYAANYMLGSRWNVLRPNPYGPDNKYVIHLSSWNLIWFWDGATNCFLFRSPIVFDTEGLGQILTTRTENVPDTEPYFDVHGDGSKVRVEWPVGKGQAWLVDNRDGRAAQDMNGKRFFGEFNGHGDGYEKLRELDTSGTGVLRGSDLDGLALWFDNGNAVVEDGELQPVAAVGVTSIDARGTWQTLPDGRDVLRSHAEMNGRVIMTEDIFVRLTTPIAKDVLATLHDTRDHR